MITSNTPPRKSQRNREWLHDESKTVYRWSGNAWRDPFGRPFIEPPSKPIMDEEDAVRAEACALRTRLCLLLDDWGKAARTSRRQIKKWTGNELALTRAVYAENASAIETCARQLREAIKEGV